MGKTGAAKTRSGRGKQQGGARQHAKADAAAEESRLAREPNLRETTPHYKNMQEKYQQLVIRLRDCLRIMMKAAMYALKEKEPEGVMGKPREDGVHVLGGFADRQGRGGAHPQKMQGERGQDLPKNIFQQKTRDAILDVLNALEFVHTARKRRPGNDLPGDWMPL